MLEEVVVVGSGVIGLSCAYELCKTGKYKVRIVSDHLPIPNKESANSGRKPALMDPEYTSSWAGAHFRPFPSADEYQKRDYKLTRSTYRYFKELSAQFPESSIKFLTGIDYIEAPNELYSSLAPGYTEDIEEFEVINQDKLPKGFSFGAKYKTWCLNPPVYLQFLQRQLEMRFGVQFHFTKLESLSDIHLLFPHIDKIVNCTGMGLQYHKSEHGDDNHDPLCYPIRGQTLLVQAPSNNTDVYSDTTITYQLKDGSWSFVIPRPLSGGIILGGTKRVDEKSLEIDDDELDSLIRNGTRLFPELLSHDNTSGEDGFNIRNVNVGLRPARKTGVCLNKEFYYYGQDRNIEIVNCYGFGGCGFEMSFGAAELVVKLVNFKPNSKL